MTKAKTIKLVIPDTGVLISLAHGNLLDLLLKFDRRIELVVTDVVVYEATRDQAFPDATRIATFLAQNAARITVDKTAFHDLIQKSKGNPEIVLPRNAGEMSIYGYIDEIRQRFPGVPTLVLFEDAWFIRNQARPRNVHLVSLAAFFKELEKRLPGFSADDAMNRIRQTRPDVQTVVFDDPAESGTEWGSTLQM